MAFRFITQSETKSDVTCARFPALKLRLHEFASNFDWFIYALAQSLKRFPFHRNLEHNFFKSFSPPKTKWLTPGKFNLPEKVRSKKKATKFSDQQISVPNDLIRRILFSFLLNGKHPF